MIKSIKHKGLKLFYETGKTSGIQLKHAKKLKVILISLNNAASIEDLNFPGANLHALKGNLKEYWSIKVSGNWRIIFQYKNGDVFLVDYLDYH